MTILVTGGAGFVGSHFVRHAIEAARSVVVLDDMSSGLVAALGPVTLVRGDIGDAQLVRRTLEEHRVTSVVHFAGKICVAESVRRPDYYIEHNVRRASVLLDEALAAGVRSFVFSSSAAVYGVPSGSPISETARTEPISPYGETKLAFERLLAEKEGLLWAALRYFNAAGAHPDGSLSERHEPETHLLPLAIDAALGRRPALQIYGDDYPTPDGTCIRDYVHVIDLAAAHLSALDALSSGTQLGAVNLGSGRGHSVRQVLGAVEAALNRPVPTLVVARREGDPPTLVADIERASALLQWRCDRSDLATIVRDAVRSRR